MPEPLAVEIIGTGRYLPDRILDNQFFIDRLDTTDQWIRDRTGILERRMAAEGQANSDLAAEASRRALDEAGLTPSDIDVVIVGTITPDTTFPSTACYVQQKLGMSTIPCFDISAACCGFVYALVLGASMIQSGACRRVLAIGSEVMTTITDYEDRATAVLFGDGAGAAVLQGTADLTGPHILHHRLYSECSGPGVLTVPASGTRIPQSHAVIDEHLHYIKMKGREVFKRAVKRTAELVDQTLQEAGISSEEIKIVIPHQSNLRIIESMRQRLKLPKDRVYVNIERFGNTSAASIPVALDECRKNGVIVPGDLVLLIAFGAGFTWASALIRF